MTKILLVILLDLFGKSCSSFNSSICHETSMFFRDGGRYWLSLNSRCVWSCSSLSDASDLPLRGQELWSPG